MSFDEHGFLGKEAVQVAQRIRANHRELFEFSYDVNSFAQKLRKNLNINFEKRQDYLSTFFFIRILESAQAVNVLTERGFELEASVIVRTLFESFVYLKLCVERESFADEYMQYGEIKALSDLRNILKFETYKKYGEFGSREQIEALISYIEERYPKKRRDALISKFQKKQLAKDANFLELYATLYSITSGSAHTGMHALRRHIKINEFAKPINFVAGPADDCAMMHLTTAADFLLRSSAYVCQLFQIDEKNQIETFIKKLVQLQSYSSDTK